MRPSAIKLLWKILGISIIISLIATTILLLSGQTEFDFVFFLDFLIKLILIPLLFGRKFLGLIIVTFGTLLGIAAGGIGAIINIIILMLTLPLWINKFAKK